jgi:hypothetical protein
LSNAPAERRARMMGMLTSSIGLGQIGIMALGWAIGWLGTAAAVAVFAGSGMVLLLLCALAWPALWRRPG